MLYNLDDLNYQFDWRGPRLANLRLRVCRRCTDKPFEFWRPVILPPDPSPRIDPRPEDFDAEMGPMPPVWSPAYMLPQPIYITSEGDTPFILTDDDGVPLTADD
jgi:hypothetical protein